MQVPGTIGALLDADIHVWMLTGDKQTTAINIGYSCQLLNSSMKLMVINNESYQGVAMILERWRTNRLTDVSSMALVVDGATLETISGTLKKDFIQFCLHCKAVLCCRVTPSQKAEVYRY